MLADVGVPNCVPRNRSSLVGSVYKQTSSGFEVLDEPRAILKLPGLGTSSRPYESHRYYDQPPRLLLPKFNLSASSDDQSKIVSHPTFASAELKSSRKNRIEN